MRKSVKKTLAVAVSAAMAVALLAGVELSSKTAQAAGVDLPVFSFEQGGQYNPSEPGNEGYITSVKMHGTDETIEGWLTGEGSMEQKQYAKQPSNGFDLEIANTGWDADWANGTINPWSIMASTEGIAVEAGHMYTISFNAHATSKKYALVDFKGTGGLVGDASIGIMGEGNTPDNDPYIELTTEDKPFTFTVTNFVSAEKMDIVWMLGAFDAQVDYAGTPMEEHFPGFAVENGWKGTVTVSDVTVEDLGANPEFVEPTTPPAPDNGGSTGGNNNGGSTGGSTNGGSTNGGSTGGSVTGGSTGGSVTGGTNSGTTGGSQTKVAKPAKVKIKKAVNLKGRKIKVTWKKVKGATKYQVKVGTKKKTTKKTTYTMKKLKKKTYKVYVRAYNKAGYGKWSKGKKVKVKK